MVEIRVDVIGHKNVSRMTNFYRVLIDGELFCTTEDDKEGFELMVAKAIIEAKKGVNSGNK
jgi:DNA-binding protein YbaB